MTETIIIRERPAATRGGALRVPALSASVRRAPWLDALRRTILPRAGLVWGLTLAGALLWPFTVGVLAIYVPPLRDLQDHRPDEPTVIRWYATAGAAASAAVGAGQWLLLRRAFRCSPLWIVATTAGWTGGLLLAFYGTGQVVRWLRERYPEMRVLFSSPLWERFLLLLVIGAAVGLTTGAAQWSVLRRRLPVAGAWTWAAIAGWALGLLCLPLLPHLPNFVERLGRFSGGMDTTLPALTLAGALYGFLTATALAAMLRAAAPEPLET